MIAELCNGSPLVRGQVIERLLAQGEYAGLENVGAMNRGYYPTIDFFNRETGEVISVKTVNPNANYDWARALEQNMEQMRIRIDGGFPSPVGTNATSGILDVRIPQGATISPETSQRLLDYASDKRIQLRFRNF